MTSALLLVHTKGFVEKTGAREGLWGQAEERERDFLQTEEK